MSSSLSSLKLHLESLFDNSSLSFPCCNYFTNDEFLDELNGLVSTSDNFSMFHMNIRSLNANHSKLFQLMETINHPFHVIVLSELWSYNIEFYNPSFRTSISIILYLTALQSE